MKMYDYSELIRVIDNVEIREEKEKAMELLSLKDRYNRLERNLVESGILDDWNRLKRLCAKADVRLCVAQLGDDSIGKVLGIGDCYYCNIYKDNGIIAKCMSSGGYWGDFYGFTYETDKGIVWKIYHHTNTHLFNGFDVDDDKRKYETKIYLLETFKNTYEIYRDYQLQKIEEEFSNRIKIEDIIR